MPIHGDNYERAMGKDKDGNPVEIGRLGRECGHHCGVQKTGNAHTHEKHCPCVECHGGIPDVSSQFTTPQGGVDPRGIR